MWPPEDLAGVQLAFQWAWAFVPEQTADSAPAGYASSSPVHMHAKLLQLCPTLCDPMDCSLPGSSGHGILQEKNTRVGCRALPQGIFLTQGMNPCLLRLLHWQESSLPLMPPGKPTNVIYLIGVHEAWYQRLLLQLCAWSGLPRL